MRLARCFCLHVVAAPVARPVDQAKAKPTGRPLCRLLEDALCTLPRHDPLAASAAWQAAKADPAHAQRCHLALAAYNAAQALLGPEEGGAEEWELLLARARLLRKLDQPAATWLHLLARACRAASATDGGVLRPVYALHASRMRLLLGMPAARRWGVVCGSSGGRSSSRGSTRRAEPDAAEERQLLGAVAAHCFLPSTSSQLRSLGSQAASAGDAELQADWRALLADCCAAMQWCVDKDRGFHRAAYRWAGRGKQRRLGFQCGAARKLS